MKAILALEDGRWFEGKSFGAPGTRFGEICFNTSMTGYQEVLTDPSYRGQIVAMTSPQIGNTGINLLDMESEGPHVRGFVIEELSPVVSSWRADISLSEWLTQHHIPGIQGIDTRALTKHLRTRGAMRAVITTEILNPEDAVLKAKQSPGMEGSDFVKEVTTNQTFPWDPESKESRYWSLPNPSTQQIGGPEGYFHELVTPSYHVVAYDFGIKRNILRRLRQSGFQITVVPADTKASDVLALKADGVFLSNGPGDPGALDYVHREVRELVGKTPIFAICLGHQILAHAFGGKTYKLKFGHRGGNHPVKDLRSGKVTITSQNHGFAVDPESLPAGVEVTHLNLNDGTVEGIAHPDQNVFSVQYHPEAAPGPEDAKYFFNDFVKMIEDSRKR